MKRSRFSDSQIINILKQAEAGSAVPALCREHGISSATFYKWRSRYVDLYNNNLPQANLDCRTPTQVMYEWYQKEPQIFSKDVHNSPEGGR